MPLLSARSIRPYVCMAVTALVSLATGGCVHHPGGVANDAVADVGGVAVPVALTVADRLYLGRQTPDGGEVGEAEWRDFVRDVVSPLFPAGLTIWRAEGQWQAPHGGIVRESTFVLEIFHAGGADADRGLVAIAEEYRRRFGQAAVLRATSPVEVRFHE